MRVSYNALETALGRPTALSIHLDKECSDRHLTGGDGQVEEEDSDPGKEKEVV